LPFLCPHFPLVGLASVETLKEDMWPLLQVMHHLDGICKYSSLMAFGNQSEIDKTLFTFEASC
jgi:hypothetical protein